MSAKYSPRLGWGSDVPDDEVGPELHRPGLVHLEVAGERPEAGLGAAARPAPGLSVMLKISEEK